MIVNRCHTPVLPADAGEQKTNHLGRKAYRPAPQSAAKGALLPLRLYLYICSGSVCQRCDHRERADRRRFAGLREQVLEGDQHRCRGCQAGSVNLSPITNPISNPQACAPGAW
jgi:hypothetical protein